MVRTWKHAHVQKENIMIIIQAEKDNAAAGGEAAELLHFLPITSLDACIIEY